MTDLADRLAEIRRRNAESKTLPLERQVRQVFGPNASPTQIEEREELIKLVAEQGGALSFGERIQPGLKTTQEGWLSNLQDEFGADNVIPLRDAEGVPENAIVIEPGKSVRLADLKGKFEWGGDLADISGPIIEGLAGIPLEYLGTRAGAKVGAPWGPAGMAVGAFAGNRLADAAANLAAQGVSAAVPGEDYPGQTAMEQIPERTGEAGWAAVGGGAAHGVGTAGRKLGGKVFAKSRLAQRMAKEVDKEVPFTAEGKRAAEFLGESRQVEGTIQELAGREANLSFAQALGTPEAFAAERGLYQSAKGAEKMAIAQYKRAQAGAVALDNVVDRVSRQPELLADEAVGEEAIGLLNKHIKGLYSARSAAAAPLYQAAEKKLGAIIPAKSLIRAAETMADRFSSAEKVSRSLAGFADEVRARQTKSGMLTVKDVNDFLKKWRQVAGGELRPFEGQATRAMQYRIANSMLKSIDGAMLKVAPPGQAGALREAAEAAGAAVAREGPQLELRAAAKDALGQVGAAQELRAGGRAAKAEARQAMLRADTADAIESLRAARKAWAQGSEPIDKLNTKFIKRVLGVAADEKEEAVVQRLLAGSPKQISGLLGALRRAGPEGSASAQKLSAAALRRVITEGGGAAVQKPFGAEITSQFVEPRKMLKALGRNSKALDAIFAGDNVTKNQLKALVGWFDRIDKAPDPRKFLFGKGGDWASPEIVSKIANRGIVDYFSKKAIDVAEWGVGGAASKAGLKFSDAEVATILSHPGGPKAFYDLLNAQINPARRTKKDAAEVAVRALHRIGNILIREKALQEPLEEEQQ